MEKRSLIRNPVTPSLKGRVGGVCPQSIPAHMGNTASRNPVTPQRETETMKTQTNVAALAFASQEQAFAVTLETLATLAKARDAAKGDVKEAAKAATEQERAAAWLAADALAVRGEDESDEQHAERASGYGLALAKANGADKAGRVYAQRMRYVAAHIAVILKHGEPVTDADKGETVYPRLKRSPLTIAKAAMTREASNAERAQAEAQQAAARKAERAAFLQPACERVASLAPDLYASAGAVLASFAEGEADTVALVNEAIATLKGEATLAEEFAAMLQRVAASPMAYDLFAMAAKATDEYLAAATAPEAEAAALAA